MNRTTPRQDRSSVIDLDDVRRSRRAQPLGLRLERMIAETRDELLAIPTEDGAA